MTYEQVLTIVGMVVGFYVTAKSIYSASKTDEYIFRLITKNFPKMKRLTLGAKVANISMKLAKYIKEDLADGGADGIDLLERFLDRLKVNPAQVRGFLA